ncbi:MAG: hypothetical protein ABSG70_01505 [Terriglobales bacterium]
MFFKLKGRRLAIGLLVLSSLWASATIIPLLYSLVFPNEGLEGVVMALEGRTTASPEAVAVVQETLAAAGPLRRAMQVAYYSQVTATVRHGQTQTSRMKQVLWIAWFEKLSKPILLVITQFESEGVLKYAISEGELISIVRGYGFPLLAFGFSLYLVRRKKSIEDPPW